MSTRTCRIRRARSRSRSTGGSFKRVPEDASSTFSSSSPSITCSATSRACTDAARFEDSRVASARLPAPATIALTSSASRISSSSPTRTTSGPRLGAVESVGSGPVAVVMPLLSAPTPAGLECPWSGLPSGIVRSRLLVSDEGLGESRLFPTAAILTAAALYATLPSRFVAGQSAGLFSVARWIVPALTVLLLLVLLASEPHSRLAHRVRMSPRDLRVSRRVGALAVIALVSLANGAAIVLLVHVLVNGAHAQANLLLRAGIHMWCLNVLVFA